MNRMPFLPLGWVCLSAIVACAPWAGAQDASPAEPEPQTSAAPQSAPKKVWTTEDVKALGENSPISTIGKQNGPQSPSGSTRRATATHKNEKWYSDQITKLEAQLPAINDKIARLQAGIDGKFTGDSQESTRPRNAYFGDWHIELAQLQKQRDGINSQIEALREQARRAGIPPASLP
jgi:hypothetical protein